MQFNNNMFFSFFQKISSLQNVLDQCHTLMHTEVFVGLPEKIKEELQRGMKESGVEDFASLMQHAQIKNHHPAYQIGMLEVLYGSIAMQEKCCNDIALKYADEYPQFGSELQKTQKSLKNFLTLLLETRKELNAGQKLFMQPSSQQGEFFGRSELRTARTLYQMRRSRKASGSSEAIGLARIDEEAEEAAQRLEAEEKSKEREKDKSMQFNNNMLFGFFQKISSLQNVLDQCHTLMHTEVFVGLPEKIKEELQRGMKESGVEDFASLMQHAQIKNYSPAYKIGMLEVLYRSIAMQEKCCNDIALKYADEYPQFGSELQKTQRSLKNFLTLLLETRKELNAGQKLFMQPSSQQGEFFGRSELRTARTLYQMRRLRKASGSSEAIGLARTEREAEEAAKRLLAELKAEDESRKREEEKKKQKNRGKKCKSGGKNSTVTIEESNGAASMSGTNVHDVSTSKPFNAECQTQSSSTTREGASSMHSPQSPGEDTLLEESPTSNPLSLDLSLVEKASRDAREALTDDANLQRAIEESLLECPPSDRSADVSDRSPIQQEAQTPSQTQVPIQTVIDSAQNEGILREVSYSCAQSRGSESSKHDVVQHAGGFEVSSGGLFAAKTAPTPSVVSPAKVSESALAEVEIYELFPSSKEPLIDVVRVCSPAKTPGTVEQNAVLEGSEPQVRKFNSEEMAESLGVMSMGDFKNLGLRLP